MSISMLVLQLLLLSSIAAHGYEDRPRIDSINIDRGCPSRDLVHADVGGTCRRRRRRDWRRTCHEKNDEDGDDEDDDNDAEGGHQ